MSSLLVSYDLVRPAKDYPSLIATLEKLGAVKPLMSVWLLKTPLSPEAVRDRLVKEGRLDENDKVLVVEVKRNYAWRNILSSIIQWMDSNIW